MSFWHTIQQCLVVVVLCGVFAATASADILIHAGRLIDTAAGEVREAVTVRVDGNRVASVTEGYAAPEEGDEVSREEYEAIVEDKIDELEQLYGRRGNGPG